MTASARRVGSIGMNLNVANALTSIFAATGQDIACVVESSPADVIVEPSSGMNYDYK